MEFLVPEFPEFLEVPLQCPTCQVHLLKFFILLVKIFLEKYFSILLVKIFLEQYSSILLVKIFPRYNKSPMWAFAVPDVSLLPLQERNVQNIHIFILLNSQSFEGVDYGLNPGTLCKNINSGDTYASKKYRRNSRGII